jgi:EpsI family protein
MRFSISNWRFYATALMLCATITASRLSEDRKPDYLRRPLTTIERRIEGWTAADPDQSLDQHVLTVLKPTSYLARNYTRAGRQIALFVAFYAEQRAGESMHSPKACLPAAGWEMADSDIALVPIGNRLVTVNKYLVQKGADRLIVLYWYQSKNRILASEYLGKALLVRDALLEGYTAGSIVRITLPDVVGALEDGLNFASRIIPEMQRCL